MAYYTHKHQISSDNKASQFLLMATMFSKTSMLRLESLYQVNTDKVCLNEGMKEALLMQFLLK